MKATLINNKQIQVVCEFREEIKTLVELCENNGVEYDLHFTSKPSRQITLTMEHSHALCELMERRGLIEIESHKSEQSVFYSVCAVIVDKSDSIIDICSNRDEINKVKKENKNSRVGWWEASEVVDADGTTDLPYRGKTKWDALSHMAEAFKGYKLVEF